MIRNLALLFVVTALAFISGPFSPANAEEGEWRHGGALFGELKYGPDFPHYEHVNTDAPKGGTLNQAVAGGFDSFNPFVVRGRPAAGLNYTGGLLYDTLFEQSIDQPSASYGLVAEAFRHPADFSSATYRLNADARWHDGRPITPEDVIWSLQALRANHPLYTDYYKNVTKAEKTGGHEITFTFDIKGNRELPHIMGDLPVLPKHWWEGEEPDGAKRDISQPIEEPPLGSGPFRIKEFSFGDRIVWERVDNYWAADLGPRKGRNNFDRIRYTYFQDENAIWEAFKKGGISDYRSEYRSQRWSTEYNFPAIKNGDVLRKAFPTEGSQSYQSFVFNLRKPKFADVRLREALVLLFNFQAMNKNLFFGLYTRTDSHFEGGELQATDTPEGRELEILEEYRGKVPARLFAEPYALPVYNTPADGRKHQRRALKLLREAGYTFKGGRMLDKDGKQFEIEFLGSSPSDERVTLPFIENLHKLGIKAGLRLVDSAQYKNRMDNFDFEMTMISSRQSLSPGNEQREYWSSRAADRPGARNWAGIKNPVVDELVERIIVAADRKELVALTKALDRILLWNFYSIPHWHNPDVWLAWWRKLVLPQKQPLQAGVDIFSAWIDLEAEVELAK